MDCKKTTSFIFSLQKTELHGCCVDISKLTPTHHSQHRIPSAPAQIAPFDWMAKLDKCTIAVLCRCLFKTLISHTNTLGVETKDEYNPNTPATRRPPLCVKRKFTVYGMICLGSWTCIRSPGPLLSQNSMVRCCPPKATIGCVGCADIQSIDTCYRPRSTNPCPQDA